jgi:Mce-associated membrane protein
MSRRTALLLALAVALVAVGGLGFWRAHELRSTPAAANLAVVDATATADVQSEISRALVRVLSYDYSDPTITAQAADEVLAGKARDEYDVLFASLQERAPGQKLVLSAQVQVAAVQELTEDRASLLVFVDQSSQRTSDKEASISAAQLSVTARKSGDDWQITRLQPL